MKQLEFLIEDKLEEIFSFLNPLVSVSNIEFNPYFTSGPEEDINPFLVTETAKNIYPLIWLAYPYTEKRNNINVTAENIRLILAIENSNEMLNKLRLEGSYKKALYPLFYNIQELFSKAANIEVVNESYELTKFPNYGNVKQNFYQQQKAETVGIWDALAVDLGIRVNKFEHRLKLDNQDEEDVNNTEDTNINNSGDYNENKPPSIRVQDNEMFIELDVPFIYQISATNTPTSYNVVNLTQGLSIDNETGIITGIVTGLERIETMTLQATNEFGTSSRTIDFNLTFDNADDFLAPYDLSVSNKNTDNTAFKLSWKIRDYNRPILLSEVYKQNELVGTIYYEQLNIYTSGGSFDFVNLNGVFEYKVRLKNMLGEYSPFSDILIVDCTNPLVLTKNESNIETETNLSDVVSYYKLNSTNEENLLDSLSNNDCEFVNNSSVIFNYDMTGDRSYLANFESVLSLQSYAVKDTPSMLSFTDDLEDKPFSLSLWFKLDNLNQYDFIPLISKDKEWSLNIKHDYNSTTNLKVEMHIEDNENVGKLFYIRNNAYPPTTQVQSNLPKSVWHHIAVTYNGNANNDSQSIRIYVNNHYYNNSKAIPSPLVDNFNSMKQTDGKLYIGGDTLKEEREYSLKMDEIIIFNKELSKNEINYLFNNPKYEQ